MKNFSRTELPASLVNLTADQLENLVERYPWFSVARLLLWQKTGREDPALQLWRQAYPVPGFMLKVPQNIDASRRQTLEVIDAFLAAPHERIMPSEITPGGEDISLPSVAYDPDLVSEELAEIYAAQRLYAKAKEIYSKLSLLYPEKSVYFAQIIDGLDGRKPAEGAETEKL